MVRHKEELIVRGIEQCYDYEYRKVFMIISIERCL